MFDSSNNPLIAHHVAACEGRPTQFAPQTSIVAAETVYAPGNITIRDHFDWPEWSADRSMAGTRITCCEPLCTVRAVGPTVDVARLLVAERAQRICALVRSAAA